MRSASILALLAATASAQQPPPPSFAERMLRAHNRERALVGTPPLRWSGKLAADAAAYLPHLIRLRYLEHSPRASRPGQAENLSLGAAGYDTAEAMVGFWTAEKKHFVNEPFDRTSRTGDWLDVSHYT